MKKANKRRGAENAKIRREEKPSHPDSAPSAPLRFSGRPTAERKCPACGKPMSKHLGIWGTCANNLALLAENGRLSAENHALTVLMDDAKLARKQLLKDLTSRDLELKVMLKENLRLTQENRRFRQLLEGAMAFRLLVKFSVLEVDQPFTTENMLAALAEIRRKK